MKKIIYNKSLKLNRPPFLIVVLVWTIWTLLPVRVWADKNPVELKIPATLNSGLHHFLDLVDPGKNITFDPQMVACGDAGISFQEKHQDSPVTKAFADVADNMAKHI